MMKLQFKHQSFQEEAARAVCDVFKGQKPHSPTYMIDPGRGDMDQQMSLDLTTDSTGYSNAPIAISENTVLTNIQAIQQHGGIKPSDLLEKSDSCLFNLTIEMETGVGKTYTYIKTMYELNKRYGWSKFIVVVPSVAIREGVYKSFQITEEHFSNDYDGKKIRFFIYNSARLDEINRFASDSMINVMIINSQAFNATGKDARRIDLKLDEFNSRKPIDVLAKTNPILIIDEPQSVEGKKTKEGLKKFKPLITLRYSATHKSDSVYNMIYRLDALDAYNKRLVKRIAVKGIKEIGSTATNGYVYLQSVNLSKDKPPTATIALDVKGTNSIHYKKTRVVSKGDDLYAKSEGLEGYGDGYTVKDIDGRDLPSVEFLNGKKLFVGDVIGSVNDEQKHRIQIRETILSHIERERQLFRKGIKVLSLFFIDEVAKYRQYDDSGNAQRGEYAKVFEEEYENIKESMQLELFDSAEYLAYLKNIKVGRTHDGYFSIDKKSGRITDGKLSKKEDVSDDTDAYDRIIKNKEDLLNLNNDPQVRFIFSHSALREGWDNPNVFQICILKEGKSNVRRRQEVGRGLRLSVNQSGERMDENLLGHDGVHNVNVLTVIASESYDDFVRGLQSDIAEAVADRPVKVDYKLIMDKFNDEKIAYVVHESLIKNEYVAGGKLTEKYYEDRNSGTIIVPEEIKGRVAEVIAVLDSVYDPDANKPENARKSILETKLNKKNFEKFQELWSRINSKSYYIVKFDDNELVEKSIKTLNAELYIWKDPSFVVEEGEQTRDIESKEQIETGGAFVRKKAYRSHTLMMPSSSVRYDLVGKIVEETGLTRKAVVDILVGLEKDIFDKFRYNPEEFILRAAKLINEQKATVIIEHITYNKVEDRFEEKIFTEPDLKKGCLGVNAMAAERHLYDHVIYDSNIERKFAEDLEAHKQDVKVYVKLPRGFYIRTPVGKYTPDWAIAFNEGKVKHIYFVAETKGDMSTMELRKIEESKIECTRKHFRAISGDNVVYDVVDTYDRLWELVHG
jgi:type III restriction enzyme